MKAETFATDGVPPVAAPSNEFSSPPLRSDGGDDETEADPLAAFLQEFDDDPAPVVSAPPPSQEIPAAAVANDDDDDDDLDAFLDDFEDFGGAPEPVTEPMVPPVEERPVHAVPPPPPTTPVRSVEPDPFDGHDDPLADFTTLEDDNFGVDVAPQPVQEVAAPVPEPEPVYVPEPPPVKRPEPPRNAVDKRQAPPPPPPQQRPPQQQKQTRPASDDRGGRDHRGQHNGGTNERRDNRERDRGDSHRNDRRHEESRKANSQQGGRHQERQQDRVQERPQPQPEAQVAGPKTGKMRPGRLFGWLVSFESADGRAIELREGKFFITGSSIRGTDLVIEDPSISTPHALMSVSAEHGLLIQDLMSERGVFMRSGDRGQYRREDGVIELKHGDWIRFGDVEFLLTVVPGGR
jgi:hypothetical protein